MAERSETLHGHDGVVAAFRDWFDVFEEFPEEADGLAALEGGGHGL